MTDQRRPRFGDIIENHWAGEKNPNRLGIFLKAGRTQGRMNSGPWWECTDGKHDTWRTPVDARKVVIPTPDDVHPRAALAAARNALTVLLERSENAFVTRCGDSECMCAQVAARVEHPAEEMLVCERVIGHPGMCMRRCKKMPGCTEPVDHRKHCTTGTFRGIDWADSAITRCPGRGR